MTFDEIEVGRWYWLNGTDDEVTIWECVEAAGMKMLTMDGRYLAKCHIAKSTDITPVPSRETWEACVAALRAAEYCILDGFEPAECMKSPNEWEDLCKETVKQIRAALAKARGE